MAGSRTQSAIAGFVEQILQKLGGRATVGVGGREIGQNFPDRARWGGGWDFADLGGLPSPAMSMLAAVPLLFFSASPSSHEIAIAATAQSWESEKVAETFAKASQAISAALPAPSITIKAVGDIVPGTNYPTNKLPPNKQILFQAVKSELQGADILFGNFESTLTKHPYSVKDISRSMVFAFRTPPDYVQVLKEAGFDVLNIANNHTRDFGDVGLKDTVKNLEDSGIETIGQKGKILYMTVKNISVALIGFSTNPRHNTVHDIAAAKALVAEAKKQASIVIISMQAGAEGTGAMHVRNREETFYGENRGNVVRFARAAIDAGADLVIGHGPHIVRAMEFYKGKLIAYSLGNFLGYRTLSSAGELGNSLILEVELNSQGDFVSGRILPIHINGEGIPKPDSKLRSVGLIRKLTKSDFPKTPLKIDSKGGILKE